MESDHSDCEGKTVEDFARESNIPIHGVSISLVETSKGLKKDMIPIKPGWHAKPYEEIMDDYFKKQKFNPRYNFLNLYMNNPNYMIIDTDGEDSYAILKKILKKKGLYSEGAITPSFSHCQRPDEFSYKNHFWFKIDPEEFKGMKTKCNRPRWDRLLAPYNVFESKDSIIDIEEIPELSREDFDEIDTKMPGYVAVEEAQEKPKKPVKKPAKKTVVEDDGEVEDSTAIPIKKSRSIISDDDLRTIMSNLNRSRFDGYTDWMKMAFIFINDNLDLEIFNEFSRLSPKYDEEANTKLIEGFKRSSERREDAQKLHLKTLFRWLKEDNYEVFKALQKKLSFGYEWDKILSSSDIDIARMYHEEHPDKFIRSQLSGWYYYNEHNILISSGKEEPPTMMGDIADTIRRLMNEYKDSVNLKDDKSDQKIAACIKIHNKIGNSTTAANVIRQLKGEYTINDIDDKFDANPNLIAFSNMVYDYSICDFRKIEKTDYITRTTKYEIDTKKNKKIINDIQALISSIFRDDISKNFWFNSVCRSMFAERMEAFFVHTGRGGNGKGVLGGMLQKAMGNYYMTAENTFLTSKMEQGRPNPTLADARGTRFMAISEPDNGADNCTLNGDFVKSLSGNDEISTRGLYKNNIKYIPQFTCHLQCNTKPELAQIDDAIKRRVVIIPYIYQFVDAPKKPNEKKRDHTLKDRISTPEYINQFMLILLDFAKSIKGTKISDVEKPQEVIDATADYFADNDPVGDWIKMTLEHTGNVKDRYKMSELLAMYNQTTARSKILTPQKFKKVLGDNDIRIVKVKGYTYVSCIKVVEHTGDEDEDE